MLNAQCTMHNAQYKTLFANPVTYRIASTKLSFDGGKF